jgi:hypothetical protein
MRKLPIIFLLLCGTAQAQNFISPGMSAHHGAVGQVSSKGDNLIWQDNSLSPEVASGPSLGVVGNLIIGASNFRWSKNLDGSIADFPDGSTNLAIGWHALNANTLGAANLGIGLLALANNTTGQDNVALGAITQEWNTVGINNTGIGTGALWNNGTGSHNVGVGNYSISGPGSTGGASPSYNAALGENTMRDATTGADNVAIGYSTLYTSGTGQYNTAVGFEALTAATIPYETTALGSQTLAQQTTGEYNVAVGDGAGYAMTTGTNNTIFGHGVGSSTLATGTGNILIGVSSAIDTASGSTANTINIGGTGGSWFLVTGTNVVGTEVGTMNGKLVEITTAAGVSLSLTNNAETCTLTPAAAAVFSCASDIRLKHDVKPTVEGLATLLDIPIMDFRLNSDGQLYTGVIAQDLQKDHSDMVHVGADGYLSADEPNPWVVVRAIQELNAKIEMLKSGNMECVGYAWGFYQKCHQTQ